MLSKLISVMDYSIFKYGIVKTRVLDIGFQNRYRIFVF